MSFDNRSVTLEIFAPDLETPITLPQTLVVSGSEIEFDDVEFFDIGGDPFFVVPAQIDMHDSYIEYETLVSGSRSITTQTATAPAPASSSPPSRATPRSPWPISWLSEPVRLQVKDARR